jgi:hypothetical protein
MTNALNATLRPGAPADRGTPPAGPAADLAPHLMRIIRRAVRAGGESPLDRAIRSAVARAEPPEGDTPGDQERRVRYVAGRLSAALAARLAHAEGAARPHCETVRS